MDLCFNFVKKIGFCELLFLIELNVELMFVFTYTRLFSREKSRCFTNSESYIHLNYIIAKNSAVNKPKAIISLIY